MKDILACVAFGIILIAAYLWDSWELKHRHDADEPEDLEDEVRHELKRDIEAERSRQNRLN